MAPEGLAISFRDSLTQGLEVSLEVFCGGSRQKINKEGQDINLVNRTRAQLHHRKWARVMTEQANSRNDEADPLTHWPRGPLISSAKSQTAPRACNRTKTAGENDGFKLLLHNKYTINDIITAVVSCERINWEKVGHTGTGLWTWKLDGGTWRHMFGGWKSKQVGQNLWTAGWQEPVGGGDERCEDVWWCRDRQTAGSASHSWPEAGPQGAGVQGQDSSPLQRGEGIFIRIKPELYKQGNGMGNALVSPEHG